MWSSVAYIKLQYWLKLVLDFFANYLYHKYIFSIISLQSLYFLMVFIMTLLLLHVSVVMTTVIRKDWLITQKIGWYNTMQSNAYHDVTAIPLLHKFKIYAFVLVWTTHFCVGTTNLFFLCTYIVYAHCKYYIYTIYIYYICGRWVPVQCRNLSLPPRWHYEQVRSSDFKAKCWNVPVWNLIFHIDVHNDNKILDYKLDRTICCLMYLIRFINSNYLYSRHFSNYQTNIFLVKHETNSNNILWRLIHHIYIYAMKDEICNNRKILQSR